MRKGLISRSLAVNSLQERYAGERLADFMEIVEHNDLVAWARRPLNAPLRPDIEAYSTKPLLSRLAALIP